MNESAMDIRLELVEARKRIERVNDYLEDGDLDEAVAILKQLEERFDK